MFLVATKCSPFLLQHTPNLSIRAQRPHCHGHLAATPCSDTSTQAYSAHRTLAAVPCNSTKLLRCRQPFDSSALHPHTSRPAPKRTYPTHPVLEARTPIASPSGEKVCRTETHQSDPKGWVCFVARFRAGVASQFCIF